MDDEEDLYDCVYDDEEGGEIYEDLMKTESVRPPVSSTLFHNSMNTVMYSNMSDLLQDTMSLDIQHRSNKN